MLDLQLLAFGLGQGLVDGDGVHQGQHAGAEALAQLEAAFSQGGLAVVGAAAAVLGHGAQGGGAVDAGVGDTEWYNAGYNATPEPAMKLKITTIGSSAGVILPRELLARLRLGKGDELFAVETPDGLRLTTYDPTLAAQMEVAEQVMREDRLVLHKLAQ